MEKRWITGQEILDRWQGIDFELLRAFDAGLCPYDRIDAKRLTRGSAKFQHSTLREKTKDGQVFNELEAFPLYNSELVAKLKNEFFKSSEVEEYERKQGITSPPVETMDTVTTGIDDPAPSPAATIPVPGCTTWEQVSIHIGNDQHIMIRHPGGSARWTREELGLENKPKIWTLFQACAIGEGHIPMKSEQMHSERQNLSNLKKHLKLIFGIEDDPIKRWSLEDGYVCKFGITMNPEHLNMRDHYANDDPLEEDDFEEDIKEAMLNQRY